MFQALEALDSMDDFARMDAGVDAKGPREVLKRYILQQRPKTHRCDMCAFEGPEHPIVGCPNCKWDEMVPVTPTVVSVGDDNYKPTQAELDEVVRAFQNADIDPLGAVVPSPVVTPDCGSCGYTTDPECEACSPKEEPKQFSSGCSSCYHCDYGKFPCNQNCIVAGDC